MIPESVETLLEKKLMKKTYRENQFMKQRYIEYLTKELEKAEDTILNPEK